MQNKDRVLFIRESEFTRGRDNLINYGLGVIATIASKRFKVKIIDNNSKYVTYSISDILNVIRDFKPFAVCFSIATINAYSSYQTIAAIKAEYPDLPIAAGGPHTSNVYKETLDYKADYAVRGEGDLVIVPLLEFIASHKKSDFKDTTIQGVSCYQGNELVEGSICPLPYDLDNCSSVDYSLYELEDFIRGKEDINMLWSVLTQRGCPFNCTFCSDEFTRAKVRYRTIDNVIDEIEYKNSKYGIKAINISDANFILSDERVVDFCQALIKRGLNNKFKFMIKADTHRLMKKSTLELMKSCGIGYLSIGVERMDEASQERINKKLKSDVIFQNLQNLKELGFTIHLNYLIGFSFDTPELVRKENRSFKQLLDNYADIISADILMPMPGTVEYESTINKDGSPWYLNPLFYQDYRPFYQIIRRLIYDPNIISFYSFDKELITEMLKTKDFFRKESIKKKNKLLYVAYAIMLFFAKISQKLYYTKPKLEYKIFGHFMNLLARCNNLIVQYWCKE